MSVLITGGSGFLGQSLLSYLLKNTKDDIYTIGRKPFEYFQHRECDLLDTVKLKEILNQIKPNIVYHLASNPNTKQNDENPSQILRDNIEGLNNLIHYLPTNPRFVFSSSVTVYGYFNKQDPPNWKSRCSPISLYSTTKLACENIIRINSLNNKIHGISVRMPALVGEKATHGLLKDVIRKVKNGGPIELFGKSPGSIKPFVHVDDAAEFLYKVGTLQAGFDEYDPVCIIGNQDSLSVLDVAKLVMEKYGEREVHFTGSTWEGDNPEIYLTPCYYPKSNSKDSIKRVLREID